MQATYQTRMLCDDAALSAYAALYGRVQRDLFAEVSSGRSAASRSAASMKRGCVREYGIPARMFNAVRVSLEGKVSGARESQLLHAETLKGLVRRAGRELASARKRGDRHGVHQKIRRLDNLRSRLARVEADRGIIPSFKTASGQRRYNVDAYLNQPPEIETVCYCRVSSHKQKDNIQRQILPMQEQFPHAAIITDVASGLNWQRKGLVSILE